MTSDTHAVLWNTSGDDYARSAAEFLGKAIRFIGGGRGPHPIPDVLWLRSVSIHGSGVGVARDTAARIPLVVGRSEKVIDALGCRPLIPTDDRKTAIISCGPAVLFLGIDPVIPVARFVEKYLRVPFPKPFSELPPFEGVPPSIGEIRDIPDDIDEETVKRYRCAVAEFP